MIYIKHIIRCASHKRAVNQCIKGSQLSWDLEQYECGEVCEICKDRNKMEALIPSVVSTYYPPYKKDIPEDEDVLRDGDEFTIGHVEYYCNNCHDKVKSYQVHLPRRFGKHFGSVKAPRKLPERFHLLFRDMRDIRY